MGWRPWHLVFVAIAAARCLALRADLTAEAGSVGRTANGWDHLVRASLDPYLVVYLVFPLCLGLSLLQGSRADGPLLLVRHGSFLAWTAAAMRWVLGQAAVLMAILTASAVASAAGLPWEPGWSALATEGSGNAFVSSGWPPAAVWLVGLLAIVAYLGALGTLTALMGLWLPRAAGAAVGGLVLVATVIAFRSPPEVAVLDLSAGLVPETGFALFGGPAGSLVPAVVTTGLVLVLAGARDRLIARGRPSWPVVGAVTTLSSCAIAAAAAVAGPPSIAEALGWTFYGAGPAGASLPSYTLYLLLTLPPALVVLGHYDGETQRIHETLIRSSGSFARWLRLVAPAAAWYPPHLALVAATAGTCLAVRDPALGSVATGDVMSAVLQAVAVGGLQGVFATTVACLAAWMAGTTVAGLAALGVAAASGFFWSSASWLPFGRDALGQLEVPGGVLANATTLLAAWGIAVALALVVHGPARPIFLERNVTTWNR